MPQTGSIDALEVKSKPIYNNMMEEIKLEVKSTMPLSKPSGSFDEKYTLEFDDLKVSVSVPKWMPEFATPGVPGQTKRENHVNLSKLEKRNTFVQHLHRIA